MKNKKLLLTLASVAAMCTGMTLSLASCTRSTVFANFQIPEDFDLATFRATNIDIVFDSAMGTDKKGETFDNMIIAGFEELFPNIHVEHNRVGGYDDVRDQIKTEISVGEGPNLAYCYPDHVAAYNIAEAVVTLDGLINDDRTDENGNLLFGLTKEQQEDFVPGFWNEGKNFGDDLMYSLPFSKSTEIMYYNKTVFDELNIKVPETWDEVATACATLKEHYPDSTPLGYDSEANWFITYCEQAGIPYTSATGDTVEDHFTFNNPQAVEFLNMIKGWRQNNYVTTQALYGGYTSGLFTSATDERCFMCIGSSAGANHQIPSESNNEYPFDVGVAPIPTVAGKARKVISQGPNVCIFKNSDPNKVLASWLFLKYMTTDMPSQAQFGMDSGYVPVIKSVSQSNIYSAHINGADPNSKEYKDDVAAGRGNDHITAAAARLCLEMEDYYFTSPAFVGSSDARDQVGNAVSAVLSGEKTAEAALKEAFDECVYLNS